MTAPFDGQDSGDLCLGIDPGLAECGWAVVEKARARRGFYRVRCCGTWRTKATEPLEHRLIDLAVHLGDRHMCSHVAIEAVEVRRQRGAKINPASLLAVAYVVGVAVAKYGGNGMRRLVRAHEWRAAIGAGKGTPAEVRAAVERHVGPVKGSVHAVDAVGIALWGLRDVEVSR